MRAITVLVGVASGLLMGLNASSSLGSDKKHQEGQPQAPELKVLDRLVGQWKDEMTFLVPKEERQTAIYTNRWGLDGRFLWSEGSSDGTPLDFQIMTYEPKKKEYRRWYFGSEGHASESSGQWDEDSKTLTWKGDLEDEISGISKWHFSDKDTIDWSRVVKDKGGKVYSHVKGKASRQKPAEVKLKQAKAEEGPPELKVLARYLGPWDMEIFNKVAQWNPKEARITATFTNEWVLDGRFMQMKGKSSTGVESIQMRTYNPEEKRYRAWVFDSTGTAATSTGTWAEDTKTLTWKGDLGNGIAATNTVRFVGSDSIEWKLIARNDEGKVFMDMEGTFKRKK